MICRHKINEIEIGWGKKGWMMEKIIGVIKGSLRKNSFSQSMVDYVKAHAPAGYVFREIDIGRLPLYNQDYDEDSPAEYTVFRQEIKSVAAILFITPEHNRSLPAALKNALDIGSRPQGENVWGGKPGAVISLSPGATGGFGANHHLRQVLTVLNVFTMAQPEAYLGSYHKLIDETGALANADSQAFIDRFLAAFAVWIAKVS